MFAACYFYRPISENRTILFSPLSVFFFFFFFFFFFLKLRKGRDVGYSYVVPIVAPLSLRLRVTEPKTRLDLATEISHVMSWRVGLVVSTPPPPPACVCEICCSGAVWRDMLQVTKDTFQSVLKCPPSTVFFVNSELQQRSWNTRATKILFTGFCK